MSLLKIAAVQVVLLALAWAEPRLLCIYQECGDLSGLMAVREKVTVELSQGRFNTEVVPAKTCTVGIIGKVKGFNATVCAVAAYPTAECVSENSIFVDKNGSPYGEITFTPYCKFL